MRDGAFSLVSHAILVSSVKLKSTTKRIMFSKAIIPILFLTLINQASGQTKYFSVKKVTKDKGFSFPIFNQANDSGTTLKINQFLQLSELELLNGYQANNLFEKVSINNSTVYGGKVDIAYQILSNNSKLLSIYFNESSCGMTCAYWNRYYNFNSGNGDLIQLKDLFTKEGFAIFSKQILKKRIAKFKKQIHKTNPSDNALLDDVSTCYKEIGNLEDYYIQDTSLFIDGENCLAKGAKGLGLDMETKFNLNEFKNYLNDYGKIIFGLKSGDISSYRSHELPQIFEGSIGDNKILFIVKHDYSNKISGIYTYLKYGKGINLEGELNKQNLVVTEKNDRFDDNGYINATFDSNHINGTWTNKNKTTTLKFVATRK